MSPKEKECTLNPKGDLLFTIDVGNSNITMALCKDMELVARYRMKTKVNRTSDEFGARLTEFLKTSGVSEDQIEGVIISSVVPKIMHSLRNAIVKVVRLEPIIVNSSTDCGIEVLLENAHSVGTDRIVDSAGAYYTYGGPVLVADFGTATTYDYVDSKGRLIAGAISVGIESGAHSLWTQTAQLPEVEIKKPATIMATNTAAEMQAGIFYQFLGGFEKTVEAYRKAVDEDFKIIVTGGLGRVICSYTDMIDLYDPNLLFKGLCLIYERIKHGYTPAL